MAIAVQGAVGDVGRKATTELPGYWFQSLCTINGVPFGANSDGLFKLNSGTTDAGTTYTRTFTLASTDFRINNPKRIRFVYIGIKTDSAFTVSVKVDEQAWRDYATTPPKTGLQRVRIPVGRDGQGRYWAIKITSVAFFRIDNIKVLPYIRSTGIVGY